MIKRKLVPLLLATLNSSCVHVWLPKADIVSGQAQEGITWQRSVQLALAHNPDLAKARAQLDAKAHNRNQAFGAYLPSVDGAFNRKRSRTTTSTTVDSLAFDLDVTQPLFSGFETTGEAIKAYKEWEAARFAYVEQSAAIRQSLRSAFAELLRLYKLLEANHRIANRRKDNAELLQLRYEAGRESEGSWRRAQAIADQAAFDVRQTQRRIDSQSLALGRVLGGHFVMPITVMESLEELVPDKPELPLDYSAIAERTPSVQRLISSAEALKAAIISSEAKLWPTVDGKFNYGYSGSKASRLKDDAALEMDVSVPLFHGGRNIQGVLESSADYKAVLESARSARDLAIAQLSDRWAAFQDAWELLDVKHSFLEAAIKRAEIVRAQYTSGLVNFQDFDIAEQELADSEKAYVQSLADAVVQESNWVLAKGATLEEVLYAK